MASVRWQSAAAKVKEALAYQLGTHIYIDAGVTDAVAELKKLGGARVVLATAPNSNAIFGLINGLGPDGQMIIVAWSNEPMQTSSWQLLGGRRSVKGWTARSAKNSSEDTLKFSMIAGIMPMVEVFTLEQFALAFEKMMSSKVHFRSVLKMGGNV